MREFLIPLPPQEEQKRIIGKVGQLMQHLDQLDKKIKQSNTQSEALVSSFVYHLTNQDVPAVPEDVKELVPV